MSNNQKLNQIVNDFHTNLIIFLDELIEQFESEPDLILMRLFIKDQIPPVQIINKFIREVLPHREDIINRNEKVFLDSNLNLFNFNKSRSNHFKVLWKSSTLDDDDRQVIWKWFDTFIYLTEQYQKLKIKEN